MHGEWTPGFGRQRELKLKAWPRFDLGDISRRRSAITGRPDLELMDTVGGASACIDIQGRNENVACVRVIRFWPTLTRYVQGDGTLRVGEGNFDVDQLRDPAVVVERDRLR